MANHASYTESEDLNYLGMLFATGNRKTPFLNMIGSPIDDSGNINSAVLETKSSFEFAIAQPYDTEAGAQPEISEDDSVTGVDPYTVVRGQDIQTCQIFQYKAQVSYKKLSTTGTIMSTTPSSHNVDGQAPGIGFGLSGNPIQNELDFQLMTRIKKFASDLDASIINGIYQGAASGSVGAKMRGLSSAIVTNAVNASSAALSTTLINSVLKKMVDSGAEMNNLVALCNSYQRQRIGALYENVPMDRQVGGSSIQRVMTDFGEFGILYDPNVVTTELLFVDLAMCRIVCCPVTGKYVLVEDKATDGASFAKQIYSQLSFNYGPEEYHGKISGLTNS